MLFPPNKSRFHVGLYNEELQYKIVMSQNATFHMVGKHVLTCKRPPLIKLMLMKRIIKLA